MDEPPMIAALPKATPAFTILIADDHWVVRESLKQVAQSIDAGIDVKEASTFEEALAILDADPYVNLILVDLVMPGVKNFEGLELLRRRFPSIPIAVISIHEDPNYVRQAIQNGVIGYIPKSGSAEEIRRALTRIFDGEVYFPRELLTRSWPVGAGQQVPQPQAQGASLSEREDEIIDLLGKGQAVAGIAETLGITPHTVRVHLGNAMRKLGLKNREAAVLFAINRAAKTGKR
jgi:DNA-binding NarL/FixJ family response regulator